MTSSKTNPPPVASPAERPFFKRLLAGLLERVASQAPAARADQELEIANAFREGYEQGYQQALLDQQRNAVPEADGLLFANWRLPITAALKKRIKADVAARLPEHAQPSSAQWKLIFSDTPATCVIAGAGAGKSTSLVLRLIVLNHYLGYPLESMTVVTFTRESRRDFIDKTLSTFKLWGIDLHPRQARERVRTFHSRILPMVRSLPGLADLRAFETLSDREVSAELIDSNPFDLRISDNQREHMNACYQRLYASTPRFRELLKPLARHALQLKHLSQDHPDVQKRIAATVLAAQRDEELCDQLEDLWVLAGAWPIAGVEPNRSPLNVNGSAFHCHGYHAELGAWMVLGLDPGENQRMQRPGAKLPVRAEWAVKRTLFQAFCDQPVIWLDSYASANRLASGLAGETSAGPGFDYRLKGEVGSAPLLDAFVAAAGFIENLGLGVSQAVAAMRLPADDPDSAFFQALGVYWGEFEQHLREQTPPIMTYNRMFAQFGPGASAHFAQLDDGLLKPLTHLMIDEFQDVSPQIVAWLRASLTEIRRRNGEAHSSLMCVGDDWQSIYGWRGSSPSYFMNFAEEFPAPATTRVMLSENYRSHQMIIDAAEHIVRAAPSIPGKKARARGPAMNDPLPVTILDRDDVALVNRLTAHYAEGDSILLLYRKGSDRTAILPLLRDVLARDSALPPAERRLKLLTYHSAKGLQADAVFLLGDCLYLGSSPWKNQVYQQAGLGAADEIAPYDLAQQHETLRLAYVAITRAAKHCYWYIDVPNGESADPPRASVRVDGAKAFFDDRRVVQS